MRLRLLALSGAVSVACAPPPASRPDAVPLLQLTCGDALAPRAVYARAHRPDATIGADSGVLVLQIGGGQARVGLPVQLWGPFGAAGAVTDSLGIHSFGPRPAGLHRLGLRQGPEQAQAWWYAATIRAGYVDTVVVDLEQPCTQVFRGGP